MSESIKLQPNGWAVVEDEEPQKPERRTLCVGIIETDEHAIHPAIARRVTVQVFGESPLDSEVRQLYFPAGKPVDLTQFNNANFHKERP